MSKPAVAVYINDITKMISEKLIKMEYLEHQQEKLQAQNFTSTISHEMQTPIETMIFFLNQVIGFF